MASIKFENDCGIPQYCCSSCCNCESSVGVCLISEKKRGCCWYFPKFNLTEIHKMVQSEEGIKVLERILDLPNVQIYNYYIHAKGYFDEKAYNEFIASGRNEEDEFKKHNPDIFFRMCPFIIEGEGCTIPARYRSDVCNFFICDEIIGKLKNNEEYYKYERERNSYVRWLDWENNSIQKILEEKNINLINNFSEVIEVLKGIPLESYEFLELKEIKF